MTSGDAVAPAMAQTVDVRAIADIVHDLLAGGRDRLDDTRWLRDCMAVAGLDREERGALHDLVARLRGDGTLLTRDVSLNWG